MAVSAVSACAVAAPYAFVCSAIPKVMISPIRHVPLASSPIRTTPGRSLADMPTGLRDPANPRSGGEHILKIWDILKIWHILEVWPGSHLVPWVAIPDPFPHAALAPGAVGSIVTGPLLMSVRMAYGTVTQM